MILSDAHIHIDTDSAPFVKGYADELGLSRYGLLSLSGYDDDPAQNLAVMLAKAKDPGRCYAFVAPVHPHDGEPVPDYALQLKAWIDAGADGLKLIETKPECQKNTGVRLDDPAFDPMFALAEKLGFPILWHNGDPATFWNPETIPDYVRGGSWDYTDGSYLPLSELYGMVERVLTRHPNLNVTLAHFYFVSDDIEHATRMMETWPNLRFDITPGVEMYWNFTDHRDLFRPFFLKYADRIVFGSDDEFHTDGMGTSADVTNGVLDFLTTNHEVTLYGTTIMGYGLPGFAARKIANDNFTAFVGEKPRALDAAALKTAVGAVLGLYAQRGDSKADFHARLAEDLLTAVQE